MVGVFILFFSRMDSGASGLIVPNIPWFHVVSSNLLQLLGDATILHCSYERVVNDPPGFRLSIPVLPENFVHLDQDIMSTTAFKFVSPMFALHCLLRYVVGIKSTIVWVHPKSMQLLSVVCSHDYAGDQYLVKDKDTTRHTVSDPVKDKDIIDSALLELPSMRDLLLDRLNHARTMLKSANVLQIAMEVSYNIEGALRRLAVALQLVQTTVPIQPKQKSHGSAREQGQEVEDGEVSVFFVDIKPRTFTIEDEQFLDTCIAESDTARAMSFWEAHPARLCPAMLSYLLSAAFRFVGKANISLCMTILEARIEHCVTIIPSILAALCMSAKSQELNLNFHKKCPSFFHLQSKCRRGGRIPKRINGLKKILMCLNDRKGAGEIFGYVKSLGQTDSDILFLVLKPYLPVVCRDILDRSRNHGFFDARILCMALCIVFYNMTCNSLALPTILVQQ